MPGYYLYKEGSQCLICDDTHLFRSQNKCFDSVEYCEIYEKTWCKKCLQNYFLFDEKSCKKYVYLSPKFYHTFWRSVFGLDFGEEALIYLKNFESSPSEYLSFSINNGIKLDYDSLTVSIASNKEILIGLNFKQNITKDSQINLKIKTKEWMLSGTEKVLQKFEFSAKVFDDLYNCGSESFYDTSNRIKIIYKMKIRQIILLKGIILFFLK